MGSAIFEKIVDHPRPWKSYKSVAAIAAAVNDRKLEPAQSDPRASHLRRTIK
jgi:hypothetical protein